ncbi:MAG: alpha/beta hydrolase [Natronospirillum sp.]
MVALHGWQDNEGSFDALGQALGRQGPERWELHALDLPGHGASDHLPPSQFYNLWDYVTLVQAYLDHLDTPVWLCGHSLGGMVATLLASLNHDHVHGLISLDMLGMAIDKPEDQAERLISTLQAQHQTQPHSRLSPTFAHAVARRQRSGSPQTADANAALVRRGAVEQNGQWQFRLDPKVRLGSVFRFTEAQVIQLCGGIQCPWDVILGEDGLYAKTVVERIQTMLPQMRIQWWLGGHHFHMESAPEALWQRMSDCILSAGHRQSRYGYS